MSHDATYPPLDILKPVAEGVWIVDSGPFNALGVPLPVRMTIVRLGNGDLWLHSPTPYSADLYAALEQVGRVRHLIGPNVGHWSFLQDWQGHCETAVTWGAPGLASRRPVRTSALKLDKILGAEPPTDWSGQIDQVVISGAVGFNEVAFFHRATRTMILTDIVQNIEAPKLPFLMRPIARMLGIVAPKGRAPLYLRAIVKAKHRQASRAAKALVELAPERVIFSHGRWFEKDGTVALRASLDWLL